MIKDNQVYTRHYIDYQLNQDRKETKPTKSSHWYWQVKFFPKANIGQYCQQV